VFIGQTSWHGQKLLELDRRPRDRSGETLFDWRMRVSADVPLRYFQSFIRNCLPDRMGAAFRQAAAALRAAMADPEGRFVTTGHDPSWVTVLIRKDIVWTTTQRSQM
jgi:hypothetical protein